MLIKLDKFRGIKPGIAPHLLSVDDAVEAHNCKLQSGALRPWRNPLKVADQTKTGTVKSLFLYENKYWFNWLADVNCVYNPLAQDAYRRVYWTGDGAPKMAVLTLAVTGSDYPAAAYALGIPVPASAVTVSTDGSPTATDVTQFEDRYYVVTYASAYGEEGPPCLVSNKITWKPGQTVTVAGLPGAPSGAYNVTHIKVYRTNTGSDETAYQLVLPSTHPTGLIPVGTGSISDNCPSDSLGDVLPSAEWDAPPSDLSGLIVLPNGALCGFRGKEVCFSECYRPHAWPLSYRVSVEYPIVSIGAFGTSVLVTTTGMPYLLTGESPDAMGREKFELGLACVSKRGTVDMGYAVIYPAPDGLVMAGTNAGYAVVTTAIMSRDEWQAFNPSSIHAYFYAGQYVGFYSPIGGDPAGFVFNPNTGVFTTMDLYATAGYSDMASGKLYLVVDGEIVQWDGGSSNMTFSWKCRPLNSPNFFNLGCAQVFADAYPVTAKFYADGVLKHTQTVAGVIPFTLPGGFITTEAAIELTGANGVNIVLAATDMAELSGATQ